MKSNQVNIISYNVKGEPCFNSLKQLRLFCFNIIQRFGPQSNVVLLKAYFIFRIIIQTDQITNYYSLLKKTNKIQIGY